MRLPRLAPQLRLTVRTWAIVLLIGVWILAWCGAIYLLIGDRDVTWAYGTTAPAPGQSYYTTGAPPTGQPVPRQVQSLKSSTEGQR